MSYNFHSNRQHNLDKIAAFHSRDFIVIAAYKVQKYVFQDYYNKQTKFWKC